MNGNIKCVTDLRLCYGLSPGRRQAIIWTNAGILFIWTLVTNFSVILKEAHWSSFIFIQGNALENVVCEMAFILCWYQSVNNAHHRTQCGMYPPQIELSDSYFASFCRSASLNNGIDVDTPLEKRKLCWIDIPIKLNFTLVIITSIVKIDPKNIAVVH